MTENDHPVQPPVAIVGTGALLPGSIDVDGFWTTVMNRRDLVTDVPATRWLAEDYYDPDPGAPDKTYAKRGAFLPPVDFDPMAFGIPPNTLPATDPSQLLALVVAEQVLADLSAASRSTLDRDRVSVVLGSIGLDLFNEMSNRLQRPVWLKALRESGVPESEAQAICDRIADHYTPWQEATFPGALSNVVAGRIANRFDFHGRNFTTDAACASSLAAMTLALDELALGHSDLVITGGVDTQNDISMYMCFSKTPALSKTGDCRPFSDAADGTILGEGLVMLALKRLADAERDGDRIYAVIRGAGSSSDGRGSAIYAPVPAGQARALRRAYAAAGYGPDTVELVEAHGTGTRAGDMAEATALRAVFDETGRDDRQWCALGSVKSQVGHTKGAAGAAGVLKAALALHHKVLPPTIKLDRPNPALAVETSPFYLNTQARPWIRGADHPRRASVSAFGFGGSNFHVTLEEYVPTPGTTGRPAHRSRTVPTELVLLSAASPAELAARARALDCGGGDLAELARATQQSFRSADPARLALVAADLDDLAAKRDRVATLVGADGGAPDRLPNGIHYQAGGTEPGRVAFLFPGQGSQYPGMGAELAMAFPPAQAAWDDAARVSVGDRPLHQVVFPIPAFTDAEREAQDKLLTATEWAQPALAVQSLAQLRLLDALQVRADCAAGHSFGELVALHAAGVIDAEALLRLARRRGELMRDAAQSPGAMLAIACSADAAEAILARSDGGQLWLAAHNAPRQVVVSGHRNAIESVERQLLAEGITAHRLNSAAAFHSPLVADACGPLHEFLRMVRVGEPQLDVFGNADAQPYPAEPDKIRLRLAEHLTSPVHFTEQVEAMYRRGVRTFIEVGAGNTLTRLAGQILGDREHLAVSLDNRRGNGVTAMHEGLGRLAVRGVQMDLQALWADHRPLAARPVSGRATTKIAGSSHAKPYPPAGGAADLPRPNAEVARLRPPVRDASAAAADHSGAREYGHASAVPPRQASGPAGAATAPTAAPTFLAPSPVPSGRVPSGRVPSGPVPSGPVPSGRVASGPALSGPVSPGPVAAGPVAVPAGIEDQWLDAFRQTQQHTAEAQSAYLRTVAEAQAAFLRAAEGSYASLTAALTAQADGAPPARRTAAADLPSGSGLPAGPDLPAEIVAAPPVLPPLVSGMPEAPPVFAPPNGAAPTAPPAAPVAPLVAPVAPPASRDVAGLLLEVVADQTGYPVDMLSAGMDLESDLGIDSIKRVQILSALRGRAPGLPEIGMADLGRLRTLGAIIDRFDQAETTPAPPAAVAAPPAASTAETAPLARLAVRPVPATAPGLALAGLRDGPLVVTDDGAGVASRLVARLVERGLPARVAGSIPADAGGVIFLGGLREVSTVDEALAVNTEAFEVAQAVADRFAAADGGVFVTVQDTGGDFGLAGRTPVRAWLGGVAALARTAAREWPGVAVKVIDCERGGRDATAVADAIAAELVTGGSSSDVGLRADGARTVLATVDTPATVDAPAGAEPVARLGPESVIVATGGGRGVAAAGLLALAQACRPRMVLIGRTELREEPEALRSAADDVSMVRAIIEQVRGDSGRTPSPSEVAAASARILAAREIRANLESLRRAGSEVRYLPLDARDTAAVTAALAEVRREWGPITGVVHAAGVLADKRLADKTEDQFARVFDTKVAGLRAVLAATAQDPLTVLCMFSSVVARYGNIGQSDYAMANEVLNQVASAEQARRPGCLVRSVAWGPWEGGMVTPALREHFQSIGVPLIPVDAGARAFVAEVTGVTGGPTGDVQVVIHSAGSAGSLDGSTPRAAAEVQVSARSHPYLADHDIAGMVVVPVAMALEWFVSAARAGRPGSAPVVLRDVTVLRKLALDRFSGSGHRVVVRGRRDRGATRPGQALELVGDGGALHYRALADVSAAAPDDRAWPRTADMLPVRRPVLYDGHTLFHGPRFRSIVDLAGMSPDGAVATLCGAGDLGWAGTGWHTDPPTVDGALQLAVLWAEQRLGGACLPMAVGECRLHRPGLLDAPVQCIVRAHRVGDVDAECDIKLVDPDGSVRMELLRVAVVLRPAQTAADAA